MLKFFRRIRKKLIEENSLRKYLIYAFGEILLIVVGIFIALQLNNWNENRKTHQAQEELLFKLVSDLKYDITKFQKLDSIYANWHGQSEHILQNILDGTIDSITSTEEYLIGQGNLFYISIRKTTFNEMVSTGVFYNLPDRSLTQSITEYYEFANFEVDKRNRDNQDFYNYLLRIGQIDVFNRVLRLVEQRNLDYLNWTWLKDPNSEEYKEFETRVLWFKGAISGNRSVINQLKTKATDLIRNIDRK